MSTRDRERLAVFQRRVRIAREALVRIRNYESGAYLIAGRAIEEMDAIPELRVLAGADDD